MKKFAMFVLAAAFAVTSLQATEVVEAIIARVGDRIVTRSQYLNRLNDGYTELDQKYAADKSEAAKQKEAYRSGLLDDMINELVLKDRADRLGITVTDKDVQDAVVQLREQYGIKTDEEFNESLRKSGMTRPEMEARLRDTLLTNKVFARELRPRTDLSDSELRERYNREKERYRLPDRAHVREIIMTVPDGADDAAVEKIAHEAEDVVARAKKGEDFAKLVEAFSAAPSKAKGGDLGVVTKGELAPFLDTPVFQAKSGDVIGPIRSRYGFHILKVDESLPSEIPAFEIVKEKLRKDASDEAFQRDLKAYLERLRKDAAVQTFAENMPKG